MRKLILFLLFSCFFVRADDIRISMQQTQISGVPCNNKSMSFEWDNSNSWLKNVIYGSLFAYTLTTVYLLYVRYLLNNMCAWNNWKTSVPLAELATLPQKNVYEMLTKSI